MTLGDYLTRLRRRIGRKGLRLAPQGKVKPSVEALEERQVLSTAQFHFDFGTATSPLSAGYTRASTELYSAARGSGWESTTGLTAYNASSGNALTRDGVQGTGSGTFLVDLPNGDYAVTATLGHPSAARDNIALLAEGQRVASGLSTAAGSFRTASFNARVTDGRLDLKLLDEGGANATFSLAALDIQGALAPIAAYGFEAGTGTVARDAGGNGLNGTISGATWVNDGKFGKALSFDGVNDLVTVADHNFLDLTGGMTLEAWVKPTASSADWTTIALKERPGGLAYALYAADGAGQAPAGYVNRSGTDLSAAGAAALPLNTWAHVATSYDGANLKLFVNGQQVSSRAVTGPITTSSGALRIGGNSIWGEYFKGLIDEVRVYNRALSATEIAADMSRPVELATGPAPTANAGADRASNEGSSVSFSGQATGQGLSFLWNFGDGRTATTLAATNTYADNGTYTATLTVTDSLGRQASDSLVVTVANVRPTAVLTDDNPTPEGTAVRISFGSQADPSSADTAAGFKYSYDFNNDGTWDVVDSTASSTTFAFDDQGNYTVRGRIKDKDGGFTDYTTLVEVTNVAPTATFTNNGPVVIGNAATFTFNNPTDPSSADRAAGLRYSYDFNNDGAFDVANSASASASHTFASAGTYTVRGRVADKDGGFSDYTTSVTVNATAPAPPTANAGADKTANEGATVSFSGQATGQGLSYLWDFGDGQTAAGTLTPTHAYADNGTYLVTLTVTDSLGRQVTDSATATVANVAPTAALSNSGPVTAGSPVTVSFGSATDVSSADRAAGLRYSYDFNNDGAFDVANSASASASHTFASAGTYTVRGRVADKDGGFSDYTTSVTVNAPSSNDGILRTFYVSTTGSDSGNGSAATPWRTLQHAANQARAGDLIVVRAGTYAGFQVYNSGTAANRIVFKADPGVLINAKHSAASAYSGAINLEGASYVTIDGFNVTLATYGSVRSNIRSVENTGVVIRNNTIDNASWWGILTGNSANLTVEGNRITNTQVQHGIYVANSADNPILRNNYVANSRGAGIQINADKDLPGDGIISNALVEGNTLLNNASGESSSLNLNGVEDSRIINNLIASQYRNGIAMYQDNQTAGTKRNLVANNTIIGSAYYAISISGAGSTHNRIFNNILFSQGWGSNYRGGLGVENLTGLQSNNNILVGRVNRDPSNTESPSETATQWRARGFDTNSIFLEERYSSATAALSALFVRPPSWPLYSPQNADYHLKAGALAIDAGTDVVGVLKDIEGKTRTRTDIGAYEA